MPRRGNRLMRRAAAALAACAAAGSPYAGERSGYQVLGARPLTLWLTSVPHPSAGGG